MYGILVSITTCHEMMQHHRVQANYLKPNIQNDSNFIHQNCKHLSKIIVHFESETRNLDEALEKIKVTIRTVKSINKYSKRGGCNKNVGTIC